MKRIGFMPFFAGCFGLALIGGLSIALAGTATKHNTHANHTHEHNATCGHKAEQHGDHTDYEDGGHHHKQHGDHWDECTGPEGDKKLK